MTKAVTNPEELGGLASQMTTDYGHLALQGRMAAATAEPEEVCSSPLSFELMNYARGADRKSDPYVKETSPPPCHPVHKFIPLFKPTRCLSFSLRVQTTSCSLWVQILMCQNLGLIR